VNKLRLGNGAQHNHSLNLTGGWWGKPLGVRVLPSAGCKLGELLTQDYFKLPQLIAMVRDGFNGSEHPLCHGAAADGVGKGEDLFPNLRGKAK